LCIFLKILIYFDSESTSQNVFLIQVQIYLNINVPCTKTSSRRCSDSIITIKEEFYLLKREKSNLIHHEKILMEMICVGTQGSRKVQVEVIAKP
jgi:hypothetical protein